MCSMKETLTVSRKRVCVKCSGGVLCAVLCSIKDMCCVELVRRSGSEVKGGAPERL